MDEDAQAAIAGISHRTGRNANSVFCRPGFQPSSAAGRIGNPAHVGEKCVIEVTPSAGGGQGAVPVLVAGRHENGTVPFGSAFDTKTGTVPRTGRAAPDRPSGRTTGRVTVHGTDGDWSVFRPTGVDFRANCRPKTRTCPLASFCRGTHAGFVDVAPLLRPAPMQRTRICGGNRGGKTEEAPRPQVSEPFLLTAFGLTSCRSTPHRARTCNLRFRRLKVCHFARS
jgi:hypothetical protein